MKPVTASVLLNSIAIALAQQTDKMAPHRTNSEEK